MTKDEATVRSAMKLALEALVKTDAEPGSKAWEREAEAITALRVALASQGEALAVVNEVDQEQPEQQEPVALVVNNKFNRAWLKLDELPGTMMKGPQGLFGPIPGSTSTLVTTSELERDYQISNGHYMLEVYTSPPTLSLAQRQSRSDVKPLTDAQTMAGYKLACSYGVYESNALALTEKMFSVFKEKNNGN